MPGFFSSLFGGGKKNMGMTVANPKGLGKAVGDIRRDQAVMKDANRETYQFQKPSQDLGMSDLIKSHNSGDRFLYAAVTAGEGEEESSRLRRLIQHQPRLSRKALPMSKLPPLPLYQEVETFSLANVLPPKPKGGPKTYINISEVLVVYGSLISSDSVFSKVKVSIIDDRLIQNKVAKSYVANTNVISKATMSLSYSFPRDEVESISLAISREAAFLEEGRQWGVAQVMVQMQETEFPIQTTNTKVQAINAIPQSMLEERDINSDFIDISIMDNDRSRLRDLYMDGDLADETSPVSTRVENVKYAQSSLSGPKGKMAQRPAAAGWEFMQGSRQQVSADQNSIDPSEDGFDDEPVRTPTPYPDKPLKSAIKKTRFEDDEPSRIQEIPEGRFLQVDDPSDREPGLF